MRARIDEYVDDVYAATRKFPRDELFGATSQARRAVLSVALNYVEGYARQRQAVLKNFLEISYGSLQEIKYLMDFALRQKYILASEHDKLSQISDRIGKMIWGITSRL